MAKAVTYTITMRHRPPDPGLRKAVRALFDHYGGEAVTLEVCRASAKELAPQDGRPFVWTQERYGEYWLQIELAKWHAKQKSMQGLLRARPRGFVIAGTGWSMTVGGTGISRGRAANLYSEAVKLRKANPAYATRWDRHLETAKQSVAWAVRWEKKKGAVAPSPRPR